MVNENGRQIFKYNMVIFILIHQLKILLKMILKLFEMFVFLQTKSHNSVTATVKIVKIKRLLSSILRLCKIFMKFGPSKLELSSAVWTTNDIP